MNNLLTPPSACTAMAAFKDLPEGTRAQLIGNMLLTEPSPSYAHQHLLLEVLLPVADFVRSGRLGEVLFAPFDVYLDKHNAFQPDLIFVSRDRLHLINNKAMHGAPDLVVEILSPSTCRYDREDKKLVYERNGVKEYWLVDPETCGTQGFQLVGGVFETLPTAYGKILSPLLQTEFEFSN